MNSAVNEATLAPALAPADTGLWIDFQQIGPASSDTQWVALLAQAARTCDEAFSHGVPADVRSRAEDQLHRTLYALYAGRIAVPWTTGWRNLDDYRFDQLRQVLESAWAASEQRRFADFFHCRRQRSSRCGPRPSANSIGPTFPIRCLRS